MNKCMFIGNLGADPDGGESKESGKFWATFSIATSETWTDGNGQKQEKTEWTRCKCFNKLAEVVLNHCRKGMKVFVCGKKETREHEGKYYTEIVVRGFDDFKILTWNDESKPQESTPESNTPDCF